MITDYHRSYSSIKLRQVPPLDSLASVNRTASLGAKQSRVIQLNMSLSLFKQS